MDYDKLFEAIRLAASISGTLFLAVMLTDFKYPRKKVYLAFGLLYAAVCTVNIIILYNFGLYVYQRVFLISVALPSAVLFVITSKDSPAKVGFNFWSQINLLFLVSIIAEYIRRLFNEGVLFSLAVRLALYLIAILLCARFIVKPYRFLKEHLEKGWGLLSVIPLAFCVLVVLVGLFPHLKTQNLPAVTYAYFLLLLVYVAIYKLFKSTYTAMQEREEEKSLRLRIDMQQKQYDMMQENIEQARIYRHDLRHHFGVISTFLSDGNISAAKSYIEKLTGRQSETRVNTYCRIYALDAVISYYAGRAKEEGIQVGANINLPPEINIDVMQLCVIIANCMENAIDACSPLKQRDRKIEIMARISGDMINFQFKNPYEGEIKFGRDGLPMSSKSAKRGDGTKSVASIVKRNGGILNFDVNGGCFTVSIALNNTSGSVAKGSEAS